MSEPEVKNASWLIEIVTLLELAERFMPEPYWLQGDFPPWVQTVAREVAKSYFPVAKLKAGKAWEPGEVGAMVGHQVAYWQWTCELLSAKSENEPDLDTLKKVFGDDIEERAVKFISTLAEDTIPAFMAALKFALSRACDQDYHVMCRFFGAFGRAIHRKPSSINDIGRTTFLIYLILLMSWRTVENLGSIPNLHRTLKKCIYLKPDVVGDIKRVEKMCERIGLSYPEIAARKARATNPDIET
jgi:hypothetical protein